MTLQSRVPAPELEGYLAPGERVVTVVHQHWWALHRPIFAAIAATVLALYIDVNTSVTALARAVADLGWLVWLGSLGWLAWSVLNWRHDWFVATDKRLLMFYGFVRRKVAMMPMRKVTDMTFERSPLGRLLGYGTFILESAGQDQALARVDYVPQADEHYRKICGVLFGSEVVPAGWDADADGWEEDDGGTGGGPGGASGGGPVGRSGGGPGGRSGGGPGGASGGGPGGRSGGGAGGGTAGGPGDRAAGAPGAPQVPAGLPYPGPHERAERAGPGEPPWPAPVVRPARTSESWFDDLFGYADGETGGASETLYRSEDLVRSEREADTGEIPVIRPRRQPPPYTPPW